MPTTLGPHMVDYTEIASYTEQWRKGDTQAVRILECSWDDRLNFVDDILGFPVNNGGPLIQRNIPDIHPDDGYDTFSATSMQLLQGLGVPDIYPGADLESGVPFLRFTDRVPTDEPDYGNDPPGRARYQVTYTQPPYRVLEDSRIFSELGRYVTRQYNYSAESLPLPGTTFEYTNFSTEKIQQLPAIPFPLRELTYTWHEVPVRAADPTVVPSAVDPTTGLDAIELCYGRVNDAVFDDLYDAETLLCIGADTNRMANGAGYYVWEISYKFQFRRTGWNKIYRKQNNSFEPVRRTAAPAKGIYETANFDLLFEIS